MFSDLPWRVQSKRMDRRDSRSRSRSREYEKRSARPGQKYDDEDESKKPSTVDTLESDEPKTLKAMESMEIKGKGQRQMVMEKLMAGRGREESKVIHLLILLLPKSP